MGGAARPGGGARGGGAAVVELERECPPAGGGGGEGARLSDVVRSARRKMVREEDRDGACWRCTRCCAGRGSEEVSGAAAAEGRVL